MPEIWFPHLGIKINELKNVAFILERLNVYWYGVIIEQVYFYRNHEAQRTETHKDTYIDFTIIGIITCIIGARFYYVIFSWDHIRDNLWVFLH